MAGVIERWRSVLGVDVGQAQDYTAIVRIERDGEAWHVREAERVRLGTSYQEIARLVADRAKVHGSVVVIDRTGIGRAVCDLLRDIGCEHVGVTITGGLGEHGANVSKVSLVVGLRTAMERGAIKIPRAHTELVNELRAYRVRVRGTSVEAYEAAPGEHDDLVVALALAVWGTALAAVEVDAAVSETPVQAYLRTIRELRDGDL